MEKEHSPISGEAVDWANQFEGGTDFGKLKAGDVPMIQDGEGGWTVPEEYRRTHVPLDEDFKAYARRWKARRSMLDYIAYLIKKYLLSNSNRSDGLIREQCEVSK